MHYNSPQMQRFPLYSFFPAAHSETRVKYSNAPSSCQHSRGQVTNTSFCVTQFQIKLVQKNNLSITYQPHEHRQALLHLSTQLLFIIKVQGELVIYAKPDRKK